MTEHVSDYTAAARIGALLSDMESVATMGAHYAGTEKELISVLEVCACVARECVDLAERIERNAMIRERQTEVAA